MTLAALSLIAAATCRQNSARSSSCLTTPAQRFSDFGWIGAVRRRPALFGVARSPACAGEPGSAKANRKSAGSIPACAGEPRAARGAIRGAWVDPHVCGGAVAAPPASAIIEGRSPRVRGSLGTGTPGRSTLRSIPACAGEPVPDATPSLARWVDPRVCGGANSTSNPSATRAGRSPRVRGSPLIVPAVEQQRGSIPACAGEPPWRPVHLDRAGVDPRVCGGALSSAARAALRSGRSPRVRGSQRFLMECRTGIGSIPACAGEPRRTGA